MNEKHGLEITSEKDCPVMGLDAYCVNQALSDYYPEAKFSIRTLPSEDKNRSSTKNKHCRMIITEEISTSGVHGYASVVYCGNEEYKTFNHKTRKDTVRRANSFIRRMGWKLEKEELKPKNERLVRSMGNYFQRR